MYWSHLHFICFIVLGCPQQVYLVFSSFSLYCNVWDDLIAVNLWYSIGSIIQHDNFLTLLRATYVSPAVFSDFAMFIHAFGKVSPWLLCIVIAHESVKGSCCLSCIPLGNCAACSCYRTYRYTGWQILWERWPCVVIKVNNNGYWQFLRPLIILIDEIDNCPSNWP